MLQPTLVITIACFAGLYLYSEHSMWHSGNFWFLPASLIPSSYLHAGICPGVINKWSICGQEYKGREENALYEYCIAGNFWGRKHSQICAVPRKISPRIFGGEARSRNIWRMRTQCTILSSSTFQKAHRYRSVMVPFDFLEYCSCQQMNLRGRQPDTDIPNAEHMKASPRACRGEGTGRKTGHRVQCDSISSPHLWMKVLCGRLIISLKLDQLHGGCDYVMCTHASYVNGHTHADCGYTVPQKFSSRNLHSLPIGVSFFHPAVRYIE